LSAYWPSPELAYGDGEVELDYIIFVNSIICSLLKAIVFALVIFSLYCGFFLD